MNPSSDKRTMAEIEKERYLQKLRDQAQRRDNVKELRDKAIELRAQEEAQTSREYLAKLSRRSEFRAEIKTTVLESHRTHEEMLTRLGQIYKDKLTAMVGRTLESADVRSGVNRKLVSRKVLSAAPSNETTKGLINPLGL